jgi:ankyrin repeat protein
LQNRANINAKDDHGDTALIKASHRGHSAIVAELLKHEDLDVNLQDKDGKSALFWASSCGYKEVVVELLKRVDVEVSLRDNTNTTAFGRGEEIRKHGYYNMCPGINLKMWPLQGHRS